MWGKLNNLLKQIKKVLWVAKKLGLTKKIPWLLPLTAVIDAFSVLYNEVKRYILEKNKEYSEKQKEVNDEVTEIIEKETNLPITEQDNEKLKDALRKKQGMK